MTLLEYEAYFKDEIASKKLIGHTPAKKRFVMLDDDELSNAQSTLQVQNFVMVLHKYDTTLTANESGRYFDKKKCGFSIVRDLGKGHSSLNSTVVQSDAEVIVKKIWAKMLKDRETGTIIFNDFDTKKFQIEFLKGMFSNCAGASAEFEISPKIAPFCDLYVADDWT
jgi:hypothetical protein